MVSVTDPLVLAHNENYSKILERVERMHSMSIDAFLGGEAHALLNEILDAHVYVSKEDKQVSFEQYPPDDTPVLHWDGKNASLRPFNLDEHRYGAFRMHASMMISVDQQLGGNSVVVDLGAGTRIQAIILRGMGSKLPVVNLDVFKTALSIGEKLCNNLGVKDVVFGTTDLAEPANFQGLTQFLKSQFGDRPLIAVSRHAIYPFYNASAYIQMFDYLIRDLGVAAGVHLERTGRFTSTFTQMQTAARGQFTFPPKHIEKLDDPQAHIVGRLDIEIIEDVEVVSHFIDQYFPRLVAWKKR